MPDTADKGASRYGRLVTDTVVAPMIGVSVGFLQRDRREAKRIPFIKLGDRVLYDPDEVMAAIKAMTIGGPRGTRRGRRGAAGDLEAGGCEQQDARQALAVARGVL